MACVGQLPRQLRRADRACAILSADCELNGCAAALAGHFVLVCAVLHGCLCRKGTGSVAQCCASIRALPSIHACRCAGKQAISILLVELIEP